jgi:outer membrane protein TolC
VPLRLLFPLATILLVVSALTAAAADTVDFQSALERARKFGLPIQTANIAAAIAHEDRVQAKAALLPSLTYFNQYIYSQPSSDHITRWVSADGVNVYNSQGIVHEDVSLAKTAEYRRALAAEAVAKAKAEIAIRGLLFTVAQDYYGLVVAQRRLANARLSLEEARRFVNLTTQQELAGEVAHADVIKAQLQLQQREREVTDAQLAIDRARLNLSVIIYPDFNQDFTVVDDLQSAAPLGTFAEIQTFAIQNNPDLRAATASIQQAHYDVSAAQSAYYPTLSFDYFYGINANEFAIRGPDDHKNLGSVAQGSINIPVWNWGATRSKLKQAQLRQQQAKAELSFAQRQVLANLNAFYREAELARTQLESLKASFDLAAESLRLTLLRYQGGEATALEVVDAQTTLVQARNAYDDGLVRYRLGLANLQTLTGRF